MPTFAKKFNKNSKFWKIFWTQPFSLGWILYHFVSFINEIFGLQEYPSVTISQSIAWLIPYRKGRISMIYSLALTHLDQLLLGLKYIYISLFSSPSIFRKGSLIRHRCLNLRNINTFKFSITFTNILSVSNHRDSLPLRCSFSIKMKFYLNKKQYSITH